MQYRSQLNLDYKQSLSYKLKKQHHYMLTGAIAILVLTLMGVVIANVSTPSNKSVVKLEPQPEPAQVDTIELALSSKPNTNDGVKYAAPIIDAKATNPEITKAQIQAVTVESLVAIETPTTIEMLTALETPVGHESTGLSAEKIETVTIRQGDTLSALFSQRELNTELHKIMLLGDQVKVLKSVRPNQKLHFHTQNKTLVGIELETSATRKLKVVKQAQSYIATNEVIETPVIIETLAAIETPTTLEILTAFEAPASHESTELSAEKIETVTIKQGDTLSTLFSKRGLNTELYKIMLLGDQVKELKSVRPNQKLHFHTQNETLIGIELETSVNRKLKVVKHAQNYQVDEVVRDFETRTKVASSTIKNSLFLAGQRVGLSDALIMELANVFGWDIDFALDIRTGDQFSVVFEEKYLDNKKVKDGSIIAAEFINAGEKYRAVRYTDSNGNTDYYSQSGRSMRKPFLRTPVDFARISSGFNLKRKHPILNRIRAHTGVDYAAATGTPIKASGDGKIIHQGNKGGYGRTIIVKHGSSYSTLYAHMNAYAKNTQVGKRVKQGQIIGYVGKSGLATGPHLHYEFRINGAHRNPVTVKLPDASPLPKSEMVRFKSATSKQFANLDLHSSTALAQNKN